ncbi:MAG: hypothetical protein AAF604_23995 [Acidobacteriota bacterium]
MRCRLVLFALILLVASPLLADGFTTRQVQTLPQTHGVNYEFVGHHHHPDFLSSAPLQFQATAQVAGQSVSLISDPGSVLAGSTCSGPCNVQPTTNELLNCSLNTGLTGTTSVVCNVQIMRFAQYGRVEGPMSFNWLVVMVEDDALLAGELRTTLGQKGLDYPAEIELGGRMVVTVQPDGLPPVRLLSRREPIFTGMVAGWPPHGLNLELSNPPIEYYLEGEIDDATASPFMVVTANTVQLGHETSSFMGSRPTITRAERAKGAVVVEWTSTEGTVQGPQPSHYKLYRNAAGGELTAWVHVADVPIAETSFVDAGAPAKGPLQYVVSHAAEYPFGYEYEGIFNDPVTVP